MGELGTPYLHLSFRPLRTQRRLTLLPPCPVWSHDLPAGQLPSGARLDGCSASWGGVLRLSEEELPGGPRPARSAPLQPGLPRRGCRSSPRTSSATTNDLRQRVASRLAAGKHVAYRPESIVRRYLDRYGESLVGHPVARNAAGWAVTVVGRADNVIKQPFAIAKQGLRRRLGRTHSGRDS